MKRYLGAFSLTSILWSILVFADGPAIGLGMQQHTPLPLNDPLSAFDCTANQVQPDVRANLQVLADSVKKLKNPACDTISKDFKDGVTTQALIQKFSPNGDQSMLAQLQAAQVEENAIMGYINKPSTAPPGFIASNYSISAVATQDASIQAQITETQTRIAQTNAQLRLDTGLQGAAIIEQFSDDLSTAIEMGCWDTEKAEISSNLAGLAGYFMTGPVGVGVEIGSKVFGSIMKVLDAKKNAKLQQSSKLELLETEVGLKCFLKQAGKTQCDLTLEKNNNCADCNHPMETKPITTNTQGDLQKLKTFVTGMKMDDKGVIRDQDRHAMVLDFFSPTPNSTYAMLDLINTHLLDMKQALVQSAGANIDHSSVDSALLNKYIAQFGNLSASAKALKAKEDNISATDDDEKTFFVQLRKTLSGDNFDTLPNLALLDDSFAQFYKQQLLKAGIPISQETQTFIAQNGYSSMQAILALQAPSIPFDEDKNETNTRMNYRTMEQMEISYGDKIQKILSQGSSSTGYIQSLDKKSLNYFCMSLLNLPDLNKNNDTKTGINFDTLKSTCSGTHLTESGKTLNFNDVYSLPFSDRVCSIPLFETNSSANQK